MKISFTFLFSIFVAAAGFGRDYATKPLSDAAKIFLERSSAVAISDSTMYWDGGSLSFRLTSSEGKSFDYIISTEKQRKSVREFLSVLESNSIHLLPQPDYDIVSKLLIEKLEAGLASGLQVRWAKFSDETKALLELLQHGGYPHDMDRLYTLATKRMDSERAEKR